MFHSKIGFITTEVESEYGKLKPEPIVVIKIIPNKLLKGTTKEKILCWL